MIKVQTAADKEKKRKQELEADRIRRGAVVNMEQLIKGSATSPVTRYRCVAPLYVQ